MAQKYFEKSSTKVKQPHNGVVTVVGYNFARKFDFVLLFLKITDLF